MAYTKEWEDVFCEKVLVLARHAQTCWQRCDVEGMMSAVSELINIGKDAWTERTRRKWLSANTQVSALTASLLADYEMWNEWAKRCDNAYRALISGMREQHRHGWEYNPFFRARATILCAIADGKWKAPDEYYDAVLPINSLFDEFEKLEKEFWDTQLDNPSDADNRTTELMAWCGLHLIKCALRFKHHPKRFAAGVCLKHASLLEDRTSPLYWDRRICELWLKGQLTSDEYRAASANRLAALRKLRGPGQAIDAFVAATARERKLFGIDLPQLEVI